MASNGEEELASSTAAPAPAQSQSQSQSQSPFANVAIAIDSYTLDAASGKRRLRTVEPDGSLTYDDPKPPKVKHGEELNRIWNEYPGGMMDLSEAKLAEMDELEAPSEDKDEDVSEREKGQLLSPDEMEALRSEVCNNLNNARNELWYIFELAKTLAASAGIPSDPPPPPFPTGTAPKKGKQAKAAAAAPATPTVTAPPAPAAAGEEGPVLPGGTFSATPGAPPLRTDVEIAHALELAIAAKQQALENCSALIDAAVDELRLLNKASDQWSSDIRTLRLGEKGRGQWAIVPKPDFARTAAHTSETAKDVVIPYALDEAPAAVHARSLAAFDLDPRKANLLQFGARSYLRLRVLVRTGGTGGPRISSKTYSTEGEAERGVRAMMEAAQLETLDEDLFNEIRAEALRVDSALVEQHSVALSLGRDKISFLLYDTRETPSPPAPHSPVCDSLLAHARLSLLHAYRRRKMRIIDSSPAAMAVPPPPTSILVPLVHLMQFHNVCRTVQPTLDAFRRSLAAAGLSTALVERHAAAGNTDALYAFLAAKAKIDVLGTVYTLELDGCPGITINITAPSTVSVVTHCANFVLRDLDALGSVVADAVTAQLGPWLYSAVCGLIPDDTARVFFDELDGVVVLDHLGALSLSIPPPFTHLEARFESGAPYDSREGRSLADWLAEAVGSLPPRDE